jgi:hypothetical protein
MRRLLGVGVVLALALALGAGAAPADPPVPVYLRGGYDPGGEFAVLSNADWKVATPELVKPRILSVSARGRPDQTLPRDRQDLAYVWAPTCDTREQDATFVRYVVLPGRPSELGFEWDWTGYFASASLYVNRHLVYTSKVGGRTRIAQDKTKAHLAAFRDGPNRLEIRITRKAVPPGGTTCRKQGVRFLVEGKFAADVAVRTDIPETDVRRVGYLTPVSGAIDVVNNGPSTVYWGKFEFFIQGYYQSLILNDGPSVSGAGVTGCKSNVPTKIIVPWIKLECDLRNMRAGAKAVVSFTLLIQIGESSGDGWLRYTRQVRSSADDPNPKNNSHTNMILLCTEHATNPACKG